MSTAEEIPGQLRPAASSDAPRRILEVARSVLSELDLEEVLERILEAAHELTGARYAALGVLDESRTELSRFLTLGIDQATRLEIGELPRGRGVLGELIRNPMPLRIADVGVHKYSYGFPAGHPQMRAFLGVPIFINEEPFGNLYLTEKAEGSEFTEADEASVVALAEFAGLAIDHARRYTVTARRRDELERTVATLEATTEVAKALGGETDVEVILELVAKRGRALVSARALIIERQRGSELLIEAAAGEVPEDMIGQTIPVRNTLAERVLHLLKPQRLDSESNRARFEQHGLGRLGLRADAGLMVPLIFQGNAYGVLLALDRLEDGPGFSPEDERLLEALAASAATAIATAETVADEQRRQRSAATENERRRWARELHDETLQNLGGLRLTLAAARRTPDAADLDDSLGQAIEQLDAEIAGLRNLITELRPASLDDLGLGPAIRALADQVALKGQVVELTMDLAYEEGRAPTRLSPEIETSLYRITQEALTNAAKHAQANRTTVEIVEDDSTVELRIRDDGDGFELGQRTDGFGLMGMRERAALISGDITVESTPGDGTTIKVVLPVERRTAPD